jgi:hypothetical protein
MHPDHILILTFNLVTSDDGKFNNIMELAAVIALIAFIGIMALGTLVSLLFSIATGFKQSSYLALFATLLSCGLYWFGDALAAIVSRNSIGQPSNTVSALYWAFWVFERFPLFTF